MSGAAQLNNDAKQHLLQIKKFAVEMLSFSQMQLEQLDKDPRIDFDVNDRIKLYTVTMKTYERSEVNRQRFMQGSYNEKQEYMKDYREYVSSDDDDIDLDIDDLDANFNYLEHDYDSDTKTDLRGKYGQIALQQGIDHSRKMQEIDITKFNNLDLDNKNIILTAGVQESENMPPLIQQQLPVSLLPEPELKVPDAFNPNGENSGVYRRNNWIPDVQ